MALKNKTQERDHASIVKLPPRIEQAANEHELPAHPARALARVTGAPPSALRPADVLALQRTIGNRAVQRLLARQSRALPGQSAPAANAMQRKTEEEEPLQGKFKSDERRENRTGLPDELKAGVENLSGLSLDDVRVHYNSPAPAEVQALAYTKGMDIHVGPGQEQHLPHEAWHVAQQKQGRVKPTLQVKGRAINDDARLEQEAETVQEKLAQLKPAPKNAASPAVKFKLNSQTVVQRIPGPHVIQRIPQPPAGYAGAYAQNFDKHHVAPNVAYDTAAKVGNKAGRTVSYNTVFEENYIWNKAWAAAQAEVAKGSGNGDKYEIKGKANDKDAKDKISVAEYDESKGKYKAMAPGVYAFKVVYSMAAAAGTNTITLKHAETDFK